jgi:enterochelin esterase family protein
MPEPDAFYQLGPDSLIQGGVPKGQVKGPFTLPSEVYPGTQHTYWVYVPAQYDPAVPAGIIVFNDGHAYMARDGEVRAINVIDNLTWRREIPVMIAVFINPGRRPDQPEPNAANFGDGTTNRGMEYNELNDKYARVIVDELMPKLYKEYSISKDPNQHAIGGVSSGGIAAFTVAWERPDDFRKVFTTVGSFTNIRGGDAYPEVIRKSAKKPIRIFMQDGRNDNRALAVDGTYNERRDWFLQNSRMVQAFMDKGYDLNYNFSIGKHGLKQGGYQLPEMMRWLWRDQAVSTDPKDLTERSFRRAASAPAAAAQ